MTRYVCSQCGYSRESAESVVEHIENSHGGDGRVMEYEPDDCGNVKSGGLLAKARRYLFGR